MFFLEKGASFHLGFTEDSGVKETSFSYLIKLWKGPAFLCTCVSIPHDFAAVKFLNEEGGKTKMITRPHKHYF